LGGKGFNIGDSGDIYYARSTDLGEHWSKPIILNSDEALGSTKTQWMPSLAASSLTGALTATWYDRRWSGTGQDYQIWAIRSLDGGLTWGDDFPVQDYLIRQYTVPGSTCSAGDCNYASSHWGDTYTTFTDGRHGVRDPFGFNYVANVYFAKL
jgi:Neuraminidase (sialidase)